MPKKILFPLPDRDFDTTEVSVPWKLLSEAGHQIEFATEAGTSAPACDPLLLRGVIFGQLGAAAEPIHFYNAMIQSAAYQSPKSWRTLDVLDYDAVVFPGGHAPGMRQYLGSKELQAQAVRFAASGRPMGAICHGVLVLARAIDSNTGRSVLYGRKTTCLPKYMERTAYFLTAWKLGKYYRTYPAYVEDEVRATLAKNEDFLRGPTTLTQRGDRDNSAPAFVVEDGPYVSARWPGDAYLFAQKMLERLK